MTQFHSSINTNSDEFCKNREDMLAIVGTMRKLLDRTAALSDKSLPRFERREQLLPRERLSRVVDPGMPFRVLMNMAGFTRKSCPLFTWLKAPVPICWSTR